ncbi:hypothetical protein GALMADRAFT_222932 [Galerina marginata CBS 339.88]|uniref:Uncharacterized protein n=1 Tax=Galerina marginata (strain CBS 339.88) TaxID=685588 RepID=A0A067TA01_GALM3|nr:hypothetical protein GALMADRAFT_222932 [Galerina marginata CBS 339.88]
MASKDQPQLNLSSGYFETQAVPAPLNGVSTTNTFIASNPSPAHLDHSPVAWHPKVTPYRLLFLSTTIALGTAKAILTYQGKAMISTTLEWIAGVVLSLLFYILGDSESKRNYPTYLSLFFSYDCMNVIWGILCTLSLNRPSYRSDEWSAISRYPVSTIPMATGYRILLSSIVATFGMVKAICAYLGLNTAANTFDWTVTVALASLLYCIGLYEPNTADIAPLLFAKDYSPFLRTFGRLLSSVTFYPVAILVILAWAQSVNIGSNYVFHSINRQTESAEAVMVVIRLFSLFLMSTFFFMILAMGSFSLFLLLRIIKRASPNYIASPPSAIRLKISSLLRYLSRYASFGQMALLTIVHLLVSALFTLAGLCVLFPSVIAAQAIHDHEDGVGTLIWNILCCIAFILTSFLFGCHWF